jgi:hypothetical protein
MEPLHWVAPRGTPKNTCAGWRICIRWIDDVEATSVVKKHSMGTAAPKVARGTGFHEFQETYDCNGCPVRKEIVELALTVH